MEPIIVIEDGIKFQYSNLEQMIEKIIQKDYFKLSEIEKSDQIEKMAYAISKIYNCETIYLKDVKDIDEILNKTNCIILFNEFTFICSLIKMNKIIVLESINSEIFLKYLKNVKLDGEYIIIKEYLFWL